jgi:pilus assembly protein Flp/PilA
VLGAVVRGARTALALLAAGTRDDRGATATEYAMLVGFIALVIVAGVTFFGQNLNDWFHRLGATVQPFSS